MPIFHNKENLEKLLKENNVPLTDAVKRGEFYKNYFDWEHYSKIYSLGSSIQEICKITGLSYDTVRVNLIRAGNKLREFGAPPSKFSFNQWDFFPKPTEVGAYIMGWLYSDGCVTHNKIDLTLQKRDKNHLEYLVSMISNKPIFEVKHGFCFNFFDVELIKRFETEYNLLKRKSYKNFEIPLEKFSETLPYLVLGLFEGDGSITKSTVGCQFLAPSKTWDSLACRLKDEVNLERTYTRPLSDYGLISVNFSGVSYFSFLNYVYSKTPDVIPLERKRGLFIQQLQRSMQGTTSPYKKLARNIWDSLST